MRQRLDVGVYEMSPAWAARLVQPAREGVRVRLLLDAHGGDGANPASVALLADRGVEVRLGGGTIGHAAHWKLLRGATATGPVLAVGSGNLIRRDAPRRHPGEPAGALAGTREWWLGVEGEAIAVHAEAERAFEAAWAAAAAPGPGGTAPLLPAAGPPPSAVVGVPRPQVAALRTTVAASRLRLRTGGAAVAAAEAELISAARHRVLACVPYVHARAGAVGAVLSAAAAAAARGCDVRLLLGEAPEAIGATTVAELAARGVGARVMDNRRVTVGHVKGLVVDGVAVVGSANWSAAGLGGNLEAALVAESAEAAAYFAACFERDWAASSGPPAAV